MASKRNFCQEAYESLLLIVDGDVENDAERQRLLAHIRDCERCKLALAEVQRGKQLLMGIPPAVLTDADICEGYQKAETRIANILVDELRGDLQLLHGTAQEPKDMPLIENPDTHESFRAVWASAIPAACQMSVPIVERTELTLRWRGRDWGGLTIERTGRASYRVLKKTGVFLASAIPEVLPVRSAAKTEGNSGAGPSAATPSIQVFARADRLDVVIHVGQ